MIEKSVGVKMYQLAEELFPICRSITGEGIRYTLNRLKKEVPQIVLHEIPTGTKVFDWVVPKEWEISEAYIEDMKGNRIVDFQKNNLHVVGYSIPIDAIVSGDELQAHLYSLPEHPDWIPYVTSYYKERWGFCVTENSRKKLTDNQYHVVIKSKLFDGSLTYAELLIPGQVSDEIFFSTYACHPSMANNELSGPVVQIELAKLLMSRKNKYSYRLIWIPETIGSITYLSKNLDYMKEHIIAGYNITCVGDDRAVSYIQSRKGNTIADRAAKNVLKYIAPDYMEYSYLNRGSDERQYNAPGIDLPVCSICRTKFHEYPEYHTSADDLKLISPKGLEKSYYIYKEIIEALEVNEIYRINCLCEPQLGPRGLYPTECFNRSSIAVKDMMDFIAYADGTMDLIEISDKINVPVKKLDKIAQVLLKANLFTKKLLSIIYEK